MRNNVFLEEKNMKRFVVCVCVLLTITSVCFAQNGKGASNKNPRYEVFDQNTGQYHVSNKRPRYEVFGLVPMDELPKPDTSKPLKPLNYDDVFSLDFLDSYRISISPQISVRETDDSISSKPWSDTHKLFFSEELNALCINFINPVKYCDIIVDKLITCKEDVFGTYYVTWHVMPNGHDVYPVLIPE